MNISINHVSAIRQLNGFLDLGALRETYAGRPANDFDRKSRSQL